jgi:hypothetical protein
MHIGYQWESQNERDHYEDEDVGGWIILKWSLQVGWGGMDWIYIAQDGDHWRALVTMVMNLQVPLNVGTFLSSCTTGGLSRSVQLHEIS